MKGKQTTMMIPIIKVTDNDTNTTHIVGTDSHDCLIIENNALHYYNLQCGCGGETFKFVGRQDELYGATVEMVTFEEFVKLYNQETKEKEERENRFKKLVDDFFTENDFRKD